MPEKEKAKSFADAELRLGDPMPNVTVTDGIELLSPAQWASRKGLFIEAKFPGESRFDWKHCAAVALHGWGPHEHHANGPICLTEAQYDGAIAAASAPVGNPKAHKPAMSQYCPHDGGHSKGT